LCPPEDAVEKDCSLFRLVKNNPPRPEDFASHFSLNLAPKADPCIRRSLSVYPTLNESIEKSHELKERFPDRDYGSHVAECEITVNHGSIKQTGADAKHLSWWVCVDVNPIETIRIIHQIV
jgi:hypothetical protein